MKTTFKCNIATHNRLFGAILKMLPLVIFLCSLTGIRLNAQCCLTNSLTINTGYDPLTGSSITPGSSGTAVSDPYWKVTFLSPDNQALTGSTPTYPAFIVPNGGWTPGSTSNYLSIANTNVYTTSNLGNYLAIFTRSVTLCSAATVTLNYCVQWDFKISDIKVDGMSCGWSSPAGSCCTGSFTCPTSCVYSLSAGVHIIEVELLNDPLSLSGNGYGFNLYGTMTASSPVFIDESQASCHNYICGSPTPSITPTPTMCIGATASLSASPGGGTYSGGGSVASVSSVGLVTGLSAGTEIITYIPPTGCFAVTTVTVVAGASITSLPGAICGGTNGTLSATPAGGSFSGGSGVATVTTGGLVTGVLPGTDLITYTLPTGCIAVTTVTVLAGASITPLPGAICAGNTATIFGNPAGGTFSGGGGGVATVTAGGLVTGLTSGGTRQITYTLPSGCFAVTTVTVNPSPAITPLSTVICSSAANLLASPAGGIFSTGGTAASVTPGGVVTGLPAGGTATITYTLPAPNGCSAITTVTVMPTPSACIYSAIIGGVETWTLTGTTGAKVYFRVEDYMHNFTHFFSATLPAGPWTRNTFKYDQNYIRICIDSVELNGCIWTTCTCIPGANCCASITAIGLRSTNGTMQTANTLSEEVSEFRIVPNPNSGIFNVIGDLASHGTDIDITISDVSGKAVLNSKAHDGNGHINKQISMPSSIPNGVYYIKIANANYNKVIQFTLTR